MPILSQNLRFDSIPLGTLPAAHASLLAAVQDCLAARGCWVAGKNAERRTVLRVALLSVGSPCWGLEPPHLPTLLYSLRAVMRAACAVCLVTLPAHLLPVSLVVAFIIF